METVSSWYYDGDTVSKEPVSSNENHKMYSWYHYDEIWVNNFKYTDYPNHKMFCITNWLIED